MRDPDATFATLSALLRRHVDGLFVKVDAPDNLYIETADARTGVKPAFFGAVQRKKAYVSVHLMPVYDDPALLDGISDALRRRMQGKSCFNFKAVDPDVLAELDGLIARCAAIARTSDARR